MKNLVFLVIFLQSCVSWKSSLVQQGDKNMAINNAINDFTHSNQKMLKRDNVFSIRIIDKSDYFIVSIYGEGNKFYLIEDEHPNIPNFPTNYIDYHDKLFYWYDTTNIPDPSIISKLVKYDRLDTIKSFAFSTYTNDDGKKGVDYIFCKNDLTNYYKVETNIVCEYNNPNINCNKSKLRKK